MTTELRKTGLDVLGDMPWGTHFCNFYETKQDFLDILVPYFKAGLENKELCVWVLPEFLTHDEAITALHAAVADFEAYFARHSIEVIPSSGWYLEDGQFSPEQTLARWNGKLDEALARGCDGVRASGDKSRIDRQSWRTFCEYEMDLNGAVSDRRILMLCTYPILQCGVADLLDVARTHNFAMARRQGHWEILETAELKAAKAEIKKLNEELEGRIAERTKQLTATNQELEKERDALRRSEQKYQVLTETLEQRVDQAVDELRRKDNLLFIQARQAAMGEMISNIAHHWRQPLNTLALLIQDLLLTYRHGQLDEGTMGANVEKSMAIIRSMSKALDGFRTFFQPSNEKVRFSVSEVIALAVSLLEDSFKASGIRTEVNITAGSDIVGYPSELSQVILNILMNAKDAFAARGTENPLITISTSTNEARTCIVIADNAGGIPDEIIGKIFAPYVSTKGPKQGTGLGLFISKTIVEKNMAGTLGVRNIGNGAEFTIEI